MQHDHSGSPATRNPRKVVAIFAVALLVISGLFTFGVWWGNERLYSARQFARSYLNALAAHDIDYIKGMPGMDLPTTHNDLVSNASALGDLSNPRVTGVERTSEYTVVDYEVGAGRKTLVGQLYLQRGDNMLGLFNTWRFAVSPTALLSVRISGASVANVNSFTVTRPNHPYAVLVPGVYHVQHRSNVLVSGEKTLYYSEISAEPQYASIQAQPNAEFTSVATQLTRNYLLNCTKQHVLYPEACPFGVDIDDQIVGEPKWSIVQYPAVNLRGYRAGVWPIESTAGKASLSAMVKNRKTGKSSMVVKEVPFDIDLAVSLDNDKVQLHPFGGN